MKRAGVAVELFPKRQRNNAVLRKPVPWTAMRVPPRAGPPCGAIAETVGCT